MVGSQVVSFDASVTEDRREAAVNSCLLAQLHASKLYPSPVTADDAFEWHAAYVNTLTNIGWVFQSGVTVNQSVATDGAEVDKALLDLITVLLPGGAAIQLASKVLKSLASLNQGDPLLTLYSSRVVEQNIIEFGASLCTTPDTGFLVSVVECALSVSTDVRQAIFFKWDATHARVEGRRYDLSLSDSIYAAVKDQIAEKIQPFVKSYISSL